MNRFQIKNACQAQEKAHSRWATRPDEEEPFSSLLEMLSFFQGLRERSRALVVSKRSVELKAEYFANVMLGQAESGLKLYGKAEVGYEPTHWAFGQLAALALAPAGYLRSLPPEMAAERSAGQLLNR